jgi:hypothetical protein
MLALAEGAVPIHLVKALYIKSEDNRLLMQRQLSRHLISLWTADNDAAIELLQRILVSQCKNKIWLLSESQNMDNIALQNSIKFHNFMMQIKVCVVCLLFLLTLIRF